MLGPVQHAGVRLVLDALGIAEVAAEKQPRVLLGVASNIERNAAELGKMPCGAAAAEVAQAGAALMQEAADFRRAAAQLTADNRRAAEQADEREPETLCADALKPGKPPCSHPWCLKARRGAGVADVVKGAQ